MALRENRIWGLKEKLFERALPRLSAPLLEQLVEAAHDCDGLVKGLANPLWPSDPWAALQRLALLIAAPLGGNAPRAASAAGVGRRLALLP